MRLTILENVIVNNGVGTRGDVVVVDDAVGQSLLERGLASTDTLAQVEAAEAQARLRAAEIERAAADAAAVQAAADAAAAESAAKADADAAAKAEASGQKRR